MTVVEALQTILYEDGTKALFDSDLLNKKLKSLVLVDADVRKNIDALFSTGAAESIREAVVDPAKYEEHFSRASELLCSVISAEVAETAVMYYYDALGFPPKTPVVNTETILEEDVEYVGQVKDGKRHGRGREVLYYNGKPYNTREGQWLHNEIYGFLYSVDDMNVKEYCFCIDSRIVGKDTHIWADGVVYVDEY